MWRALKTEGQNPSPRANHSSAVIKNNLCIFGGWDGSKRLNDLYYLDTGLIFFFSKKKKGKGEIFCFFLKKGEYVYISL